MFKESQKTIVIKIGTHTLLDDHKKLRKDILKAVVAQTVALRKKEYYVIIVTSGAVTSGRWALGVEKVSKYIPDKQMYAAVGQIYLMRGYEKWFSQYKQKIGQLLLNPGDFERRESFLSIKMALQNLLEHGIVPVLNENDATATEHLRFVDNDKLAALVAGMVHARLLINLTQVGGLFTADPNKDANARRIPRVEKITKEIEGYAGVSKSKWGSGGMVSKIEAAKIAGSMGVPMVMASAEEKDAIIHIVAGEDVGTYFVPQGKAGENRDHWIVSRVVHDAYIMIDDGAAEAVRQRRSLLPIGIIKVVGDFKRYDSVCVLNKDKELVAYGRVNYGAGELKAIARKRSGEIANTLGYDYGSVAIHVEDVVVVGKDDRCDIT